MPQLIEGHLSAHGLGFAIVASRFNGLIVEPLPLSLSLHPAGARTRTGVIYLPWTT